MKTNEQRSRAESRRRVAAVALVGVVSLAACGTDADGSSLDRPGSTDMTTSTTEPATSTSEPETSTTGPDTTAISPDPTDAAAGSAPASSTPPGPRLAALQTVLDDARAQLPAADATIQAAVVSRGVGLEWASTSGPDTEPDRPFRMASVGKTFTAATVLRLVETGRIGLDDPIGALLTPDTVALLEDDGYDLAMITVAQLLQHTAGLYDYAFGDGSPFLTDALADRRRVWTRREQLELATSVGDPLWAPGDAFAYSDTGYVLLGEIIEVETGRPYADAMRDLLGFERLGLDHLWLEHGQAAPDDLLPMSRSFFGADEVSDLDFSLDAFGGGGLAGTTTDVARFFGALFDGEVFVDPNSLATMTTVPPTNVGQEEFGILLGDGGHGVYRMTVAGQECWSHRGFLGTIAMACPGTGTAVVVTTNTALTDPLPIATALLELTLAT
ncbi:MAG: serine hydrolase [Actinobacteria bacterium]|nr:serine hydrolase [Actinomycetota bacterium]